MQLSEICRDKFDDAVVGVSEGRHALGETVLIFDTNQIRDAPMFDSRDFGELLSKP